MSVEEVGKTNLAPANFPKTDHDEWKEFTIKDEYPFSVDHVKEFAEFCRFSGGFKIYSQLISRREIADDPGPTITPKADTY